MALDFQRPDPSSPAAVASAQFTVTRRGYREDEVRDFLRQVSVELGRLIERERFLENELKALAARGPVDVSAIDEAAVAELLGAEAARVLSAAREAAQAMRDRAAESAEQIVREATREAARMLEESTLEASRRRTDVSSEAEQEIELAKQQGREMVAEVRAYRERVLADLAKRTEEARRELERLVHERERLLGAFERARHAATDVVGDLNEFDQAIRETGIVPPLVPPDAPPPPPRPTRRSDTPIFDAKQYEDELGAAHQEGQVAVEQQVGDPAHGDVAYGDVVLSDVDRASVTVAGANEEEKPAMRAGATPTAPTPQITSTPTPPSEPDTKVDTGTAAPLEPPAQDEVAMAPVVNIFDRRRKKSAAAETPTSVTPVRMTPEHPVFERSEGQPDEAPTVDAERDAETSDANDQTAESRARSSQVDDIFARLRTSSTQRVAEEAKQDLETSPAKKSKKKTSTPDDATAPGGAQSTKGDPTRNALRPTEVDPGVFRHRDEAISAVLDSITRMLKRVLADDENAILTHVGGKRTSLASADMLPNESEQAGRHAHAVRDSVTSIAVEAARSITDSRRSDLRMTIGNDALIDAVAELLVRDFIRPMHERIAVAVESAAGERDATLNRVRAVFGEWRSQRAEITATDIAHLAYARGLFMACDAQGHVCWAVDPSGPPCADAEDNALAGAQRHGVAFPTGHAHPIAHAGCRCLVVPLDK